MAIRGSYREFAGLLVPTVRAWVAIPNLGTFGDVLFLVDTGATRTILHPIDLSRTDTPAPPYANAPVHTAGGIGGSVDYAEVRAHVYFLDTGIFRRSLREFTVGLSLPATQADYNKTASLPSLLGRDILDQCRCTFDYKRNRVSLSPR